MSSSFIDFTEVKRDYSKVGLRRNPFPALAVAEENPRITADREKARDKFLNVMYNLRQEGESATVVFIGDYGNGKSHLLRVFYTAVKEQLYSMNQGTFPILVKSPGKNIVDYVIEIFSSVGLEMMIKLSNKVIKDYIENNKTEFIEFLQDDFKQKFKDAEEMPIEEILQYTRKKGFFEKMRKTKFSAIVEDDFLFSFLHLSTSSNRSTAWNWLSGAKISKEERDTIMATSLNENARKAKLYLRDFIQILMNIGFGTVAFFIDEFEKLVQIPASQRKTFQDDIRDIIDQFTKRVALFFAVTPHEWDVLDREPTALGRRLRNNIVQLLKFNEKDTRELIELYLNSERIDTDSILKEKFPNCDKEFAPFTIDAIDEIIVQSDGMVHSILEYCRTTLEFFILHDFPEINKAIVKKALK